MFCSVFFLVVLLPLTVFLLIIISVTTVIKLFFVFQCEGAGLFPGTVRNQVKL